MKQEITIALEDMSFFGFHGVYEEERKIGRSFLVSVYLQCSVDIDGSDQLGETFNYEWIQEIVADEMNRPRKLLETVAYFIAKRLRSKSDLLRSGEIKICKENLPLEGKIGRSIIIFPV